MIGLLQRVSSASVKVNDELVGEISRGLAVLIGVQCGDGSAQARRLAERLVNYRVFPDEADRMNLNLKQVAGGLLLVPQFTLAADTQRGNRPSFTRAAEPQVGEKLFNELVDAAARQGVQVATGRFGADMQLSLVNDGPVTFRLEVAPEGH